MHLSLLALCTHMVFFHGASSHLFPQAALHLVTNGAIPKEYKRQASDNAMTRCVSDRLDVAFQGNNSRFVSECKSAGTREIDIGNADRSELQSQFSSIYRTFCIRECGVVILDVYNQCGVFDTQPGGEKFTVDLCGTNQNGDVCYELYTNGLDLITTEASCYRSYTITRTCSCRSSLSAGVTTQGCCTDAYHDLVASLAASYSPATLYSVCNVNSPEGCNNSPLIGTTRPPTTRPPTTRPPTTRPPTTRPPTTRPPSNRNSGSLSLISAFTLLSALVLTTMLV